jgi:plastocyanin
LLGLPALIVALVPLFIAGTGATAAANTLNVKAGSGATGYSVNLFAPGTIYIAPGDTVKWTFPWQEPHSVTFGTPTGDPSVLVGGENPSYDGTSFISSGLVFGGAASTASYSVTFPNKGTYAYFCILHPGMKGSVVVQTPDIGQPDNQASVDARGDLVVSSAMSELKALAAASGAQQVAVTSRPGGGRKYSLAISSAHDSNSGDVQQFFPATINIGVNDSIEWVSNVHTPHTVTFGNPADVAKLIPPGGADAVLGIAAAVPAGGKYDGTGIVNSAVLGIGYPAGTKFELAFSKAGTYQYYCFLHADQGMAGTVQVGAAPGAPNTGSVAITHERGGDAGLWLVAGAIAITTLLGATAVYAVKRES